VDCWLLVREVVTSVFVSGGAAGSFMHNEGRGLCTWSVRKVSSHI